MIHIYPVNRTTGTTSHFTGTKIPCWCNPEIKKNCSESNEQGKCLFGCWRCGGSGLVEPYDDNNCNFIIHNEGNEICYPSKDDEDLKAK